MEYTRDTLDDRQAKADTARDPCALVEPVEFLKHRAALGVGNADAGVIDFDAKLAAAAPASDQYGTLGRVFDRIGHEVLQQPP